MSHRAQYDKLVSELRRLHEIESIGALLGWDEEVNLPANSGPLRAAQHGALAAALHRESTASALGELIAGLHAERDRLDPAERATVDWAHREFHEATALPAELVERRARLGSESCLVWRKARADKNFSEFAPWLERQVEINREVAGHLGKGDHVYDWCIERHDPGLDAAFVGEIFGRLREGLIPLSREILSRKKPSAPEKLPDCDDDAQLAFCREVTAALGFDYTRGRIDKSTHPFCSGGAHDCRLTTRFDPRNPADGMLSAIHEAGHGMYAQGLPTEFAGSARGRDAGMGVHESQSRLWENQVARSVAFWRWCEPKLHAKFPHWLPGEGAEGIARRMNAPAHTLIRVDADEATYNQHILLRFELERRLFDGALRVRDLPEAWRAQSIELLGMAPAHDGEGVLQDIHWSWGEFGYFPSYTLGNMISASLWETFREQRPGWEDDFARGEFAPLLSFLRDRVHRHGRTMGARELCRTATGAELAPDALLRHLRERYL
jgi:carboxypeptidase Taq